MRVGWGATHAANPETVKEALVNHNPHPRLLTVAVLVAMSVVPDLALGQAGSQPGSQASTAVPAWLAWKVFHESLTFYRTRSGAQVNDMLAAQFGLDGADAAVLSNVGQEFVAAMERIDSEAKAEVQARYGSVGPPVGLPRPTTGQEAGSSGATMVRQPAKTLLDKVRESGLYDQVEAKKRAALAAHLGELTGALSPAKMARIGEWVQTSVAPRIKTFDRGTPVPALNPPQTDGRLLPR